MNGGADASERTASCREKFAKLQQISNGDSRVKGVATTDVLITASRVGDRSVSRGF
jgi:hypothetical protein